MKNYLFLLLIFIVCTKGVCAQSVSLSVSPSRHEVIAKPGSEISLKYEVTNLGDPTYISVDILPFTPVANGTVSLASKKDNTIRFTTGDEKVPFNKPLFVGSKETVEVLVDLVIPENLKEADYYYAFVAAAEPPPGTEGGISVRVQQQILSQMYITVTRTGIVEIKPQIALFTISPAKEVAPFKWLRIVDSDYSIPVLLTVANNGASAYEMSGALATSHFFGSTSFQIPQQRVLASSTKTLELPPVTGAFLGPVTLNLELKYGESGVKNYSSLTFFAIPFRLWPVLVFPIIILIFILLTRNRHTRH